MKISKTEICTYYNSRCRSCPIGQEYKGEDYCFILAQEGVWQMNEPYDLINSNDLKAIMPQKTYDMIIEMAINISFNKKD